LFLWSRTLESNQAKLVDTQASAPLTERVLLSDVVSQLGGLVLHHGACPAKRAPRVRGPQQNLPDGVVDFD